MSPAASDKPRRIHSRYQDGTPVYDGQEPLRLPLTNSGRPIADPAAEGNQHTRLRWDSINGRIYQARQFRKNGIPEHDIDFTNITNEAGIAWSNAPLPHKQRFKQNIPGNSASGYKRSREHEPLTSNDYFDW